jgi:peptidoglycan L-alanyl-D-glutamate endopeptidase CwlK
MLNSRKIDDLNPRVQPLARAFIAACKAQGLDIIITSTYRDKASQDALYAQGRTTPGDIVTKARGGQSFHNYAVAFDFGVIVHGKYQQNDKGGLYTRAGKIAESVGLEWAGRWVHFKELCHCQFTSGLTLADFMTGKRL